MQHAPPAHLLITWVISVQSPYYCCCCCRDFYLDLSAVNLAVKSATATAGESEKCRVGSAVADYLQFPIEQGYCTRVCGVIECVASIRRLIGVRLKTLLIHFDW